MTGLEVFERKADVCWLRRGCFNRRRYVAGQWTRPDAGEEAPGLDAFDASLAGRTRTLGLWAWPSDAWTLDLDRLRQCHIHIVAPDRRVIPFCAYNLTDAAGRPPAPKCQPW